MRKNLFSYCREIGLKATIMGCRNPRVILPTGDQLCSEPEQIEYGSQLLKDPGFELVVPVVGGGPLGDSIPTRQHDTPGQALVHDVIWPHATDDPVDWPLANCTTGWFNQNGLYGPLQYWQAVAVSPRSGAYHARWVKQSGSGAGPPDLSVYAWPVHHPTYPDPTLRYYGFSGKCDVGDIVTFSVWDKVSTLTGSQQGQLYIEWYVGNGGIGYGPWFGDYTFVGGPVYNLATAYTFREVSFVAPDGGGLPVYFVLHYGAFGSGLAVGQFIDVDDCVMSIL